MTTTTTTHGTETYTFNTHAEEMSHYIVWKEIKKRKTLELYNINIIILVDKNSSALRSVYSRAITNTTGVRGLPFLISIYALADGQHRRTDVWHDKTWEFSAIA